MGNGGSRIESYKDLQVWRTGMDLAVDAYRLTEGFPREEQFGLTSQIRRAAVSIPANIAEGWGRKDRGDYLRFLRIAQGSLNELSTLILLSIRVARCEENQGKPLLQCTESLGKQLLTLQRKLAAKDSSR